MGDNFIQGSQSLAPRAIPQFNPTPTYTPRAQPAFKSTRPAPAAGQLSPLESAFLSDIQGFDLAGGVGRGLGMIEGSGQIDFPSILAGVSQLLRPSLVDQPFERGAAALREQGALTGNLSSTGTTSAITDLLGQLENQFAGVLPGAVANIGLPMAAQRLGAGQALIQGNLGVLGAGGLGREISQQDFLNRLNQQDVAGRAFANRGAGVQGLSSGLYQPMTGPSPFENLIGAVLPVAGLAAGGK